MDFGLFIEFPCETCVSLRRGLGCEEGAPGLHQTRGRFTLENLTVDLVSNGGTDIFVAKYDTTGTLLWLRQIGGGGNDRATALAWDSATGSLLVAGFFSGAVGFGSDTLTSFGGSDIFLARYDQKLKEPQDLFLRKMLTVHLSRDEPG